MSLPVFTVDFFKSLKLFLFPVRYLYNAHPGDVLLQKSIEVSHCIPDLVKSNLHLLFEDIGGYHQKGESTKAYQGQLPVYIKHNTKDSYQLQKIADNSRQAFAKHVR